MDQLAEVLAQLAGRFGVAAEQVWPHVVYVTWLQAWCAVAGALLAIVIVGIVAGVIWRCYKNAGADFDSDGWAPVLGFGALILSLFMGLIIIVSNLPGIIDPLGVTVIKLLGK